MSDSTDKVDPFSALGNLNDFQPKAHDEIVVPEKQQIDAVASAHGFTTRNFGPETETKQYLRKPGEQSKPTVNASMRIYMSDWNKFTDWCKRNRYTAKIGFEVLMSKID